MRQIKARNANQVIFYPAVILSSLDPFLTNGDKLFEPAKEGE